MRCNCDDTPIRIRDVYNTKSSRQRARRTRHTRLSRKDLICDAAQEQVSSLAAHVSGRQNGSREQLLLQRERVLVNLLGDLVIRRIRTRLIGACVHVRGIIKERDRGCRVERKRQCWSIREDRVTRECRADAIALDWL